MRKVFCFAMLALAVAVSGAPAEKAKFTAKVELKDGKNILKPGTDIDFSIQFDHPEEYFPVYWRAILTCLDLPESFLKQTGLEPNKVKDPRWRQVYLLEGRAKQPVRGYFPLSAPRSQKQQHWSFSTRNWPEGDYSVTIQVMFQHRDLKSLQDKKLAYRYAHAKLDFTLEN